MGERTDAFESLKIKVAKLRLGLVLTKKGGVLGPLKIPLNLDYLQLLELVNKVSLGYIYRIQSECLLRLLKKMGRKF